MAMLVITRWYAYFSWISRRISLPIPAAAPHSEIWMDPSPLSSYFCSSWSDCGHGRERQGGLQVSKKKKDASIRDRNREFRWHLWNYEDLCKAMDIYMGFIYIYRDTDLDKSIDIYIATYQWSGEIMYWDILWASWACSTPPRQQSAQVSFCITSTTSSRCRRCTVALSS